MGIEKRKGKRAYYYRYVRENGKRRKRYVGMIGDPVVALMIKSYKLTEAYDGADVEAIEQELADFDRLEPVLRLLATRVVRCCQRHREKVKRSGKLQDSTD